MKPQTPNTGFSEHLSAADLQMIVSEQETEWPQSRIETHLSVCPECQERVLRTAADPEWRSAMSSSLLEPGPDLSAADHTGSYLGKRFGEPTVRRDEGDEFEMQAVRQALDSLLDSPRHPEMMGRLGRYDIESVIGCGGMGVVLRGFDQELHRPVAIKMVLPRWARNGTAKQRFAREARAAAAILHPSVIAIHGIDETAGVPWFVMPYVAGPSLQSLVDDQGPLPETEIFRIGMQIASGLAAAHSQGLVHRDIKPGNILVDNQVNRVVITDFGLARCETDESMTRTGWLAGTLNYMSPEQSRGENCDARSDLFSLGSLLYFLATGRLPFRADSPMGVLHKIGHEQPQPVRHFNEQISQTLSNVIERLLEKKPADRFQSAAELETLLSGCLAHWNQPTTVPMPATGYLSSVGRMRRMKWAAATLLVVSLSAIAALVGTGRLWPGVPSRPEESHRSSRDATPAPIAETWRSIADRYGLDDAVEFDQRLSETGAQIRELGELLDGGGEWPANEALNHQLEKLQREFGSEDFR